MRKKGENWEQEELQPRVCPGVPDLSLPSLARDSPWICRVPTETSSLASDSRQERRPWLGPRSAASGSSSLLSQVPFPF